MLFNHKIIRVIHINMRLSKIKYSPLADPCSQERVRVRIPAKFP